MDTDNKDEVTDVSILNLFQIGSITKTFTAVLVLRLEAFSLLDIEDPIEKYLPEYLKWGRVTIEDVKTFWNVVKRDPYTQ